MTDYELEAIKIVQIDYHGGYWHVMAPGRQHIGMFDLQAEAEHYAECLRQPIAAALQAAEQRGRDQGAQGEHYHARQMIATIQVLIAAHRHPHMYNVAGVIEDAEQLWRSENDRLLAAAALRAAPGGE